MKTIIAIVAAIALIGIATPATADPIAVAQFYVDDDLSVWEETNGADGLQTEDLFDEETGELILPKDTQHL